MSVSEEITQHLILNSDLTRKICNLQKESFSKFIQFGGLKKGRAIKYVNKGKKTSLVKQWHGVPDTTSLSILNNEQITSEQYDNSRPLICQETACELKHKLVIEASQGSMLSNNSTSLKLFKFIDDNLALKTMTTNQSIDSRFNSIIY